jgi:Fe-S-cluster containining protein
MESDRAFFNCTQCGDCCKGYGGTYITEQDMAAIAAHMDLPLSGFKKRYCSRSGKRYVLAQREDGYCIFWDGNCKIHAIKPAMCKKWPFIDSLLKDIGNWQIMSRACPGIRLDVEKNQLLDFVCKSLSRSDRSNQ